MSAHKVVGRYKEQELQQSWDRGKPLTQAKKSVYVTESDFLKYSPMLIMRWRSMYYVEIYKMNQHGEWQQIEIKEA